MTRHVDDTLRDSPTHLFHRLTQCVTDAFEVELGEVNLTERQVSVLIAVAHSEGLSQTGLVEHTAIDRSTLADIVRRLQRKGLLQRRRTPADRRAYAVKLTEEGRRVLRSAEPELRRVDERILEALPPKDRKKFIGELKAIIASFEKASSAGR